MSIDTITTASTSSAASEDEKQVSWMAVGLLAAVAIVSTWWYAHSATGAMATTIGLSDNIENNLMRLPTRNVGFATSALLVGLVGFAASRAQAERALPSWFSPMFGAIWIVGFFVRVLADAAVPLPNFLASALLLSVPLVFGSLSGVLCERSGVVNIAIEGQLLAGAFASAFLSSVAKMSGAGTTVSLIVGVLGAAFAGALVSVLLALFTIKYHVDQIVVGVVLNVLVIGLTGFIFRRVFSNYGELNSPDRFPIWSIPGLAKIPVIGPVLFHHTPLVYLMFLTVAIIHVGLFMTAWGLRVRAVGEHPKAADTVGINVNRHRTINVLLAGVVAGVGGTFYTLASVGAFGREVTAGAGFISLAAMIFGRWSPLGAVSAALLFGFAYQMQQTLSSVGSSIPSELMGMAPYLATIVAVTGLVGKVRAPAADGVPYTKG